jgi:transposase
VDEIAECLKYLDVHEAVTINKRRKNAKERPSCPIIIHRRNMSLDEHRRVIWLRFGSLDSMDEQWHSSSQVF